MLKTVDPSSLS